MGSHLAMFWPVLLIKKSIGASRSTPVMSKALSSMAQTGQEWSRPLSLEYSARGLETVLLLLYRRHPMYANH